MKANEGVTRSPKWLRNFIDFEINTGEDIKGEPSQRRKKKMAEEEAARIKEKRSQEEESEKIRKKEEEKIYQENMTVISSIM